MLMLTLTLLTTTFKFADNQNLNLNLNLNINMNLNLNLNLKLGRGSEQYATSGKFSCYLYWKCVKKGGQERGTWMKLRVPDQGHWGQGHNWLCGFTLWKIPWKSYYKFVRNGGSRRGDLDDFWGFLIRGMPRQVHPWHYRCTW